MPTMLLITHDEALAERIADRVVRIAHGRILTASEATT
jgi:ABC-type glutathione transport system ATPase component